MALYHLNRLAEAREQFDASCDVDEDDLEPWLWRFLVRAGLGTESSDGRVFCGVGVGGGWVRGYCTAGGLWLGDLARHPPAPVPR